MIDTFDPTSVTSRLVRRLRSVSGVLLASPPPPAGPQPSRDAATILEQLVAAVQRDPSHDRMWLLCTAVFGRFPTADDVGTGARFFQLAPSVEAFLWLLDRAVDTEAGTPGTGELRIITDRVVVDVDHSARHDLHTGIQQVVRSTLARWDRDHPIEAVAWNRSYDAWRSLSPAERRRVQLPAADQSGANEACEERDPKPPRTLVVPWRTAVVIPETPPIEACERLAALAQYSGNSVLVVGHDCVPVVSADLLPPAEPHRFARYLTVLKYARRVAAVSGSATMEFSGFASAVAAQGLPGPTVVTCRLGAEHAPLPESGPQAEAGSRPPLVLCVGTVEPRKNHGAVLYAAERLWREGLVFELLFVAGSGWVEEVPRRIQQLRERGRPISSRRAVSQDELVAAYRRARFTVFPSLHEGYGLPVTESLAYGTPVITTNYGSTAETAAAGGALTIDPRDDEALAEAMRRLLTDDELWERLRREIQIRPVRSWEDYAAELWDCLVQPEWPDGSASLSR
jgi:glycosyltransferase involved in cell wall biosynthesis